MQANKLQRSLTILESSRHTLMTSVFVETAVGYNHTVLSNRKVAFIITFASALPQRLENQCVAEGLLMSPLNMPPLRIEHQIKGRIHPTTFDLHVQVLPGLT
jgi:hypothetical protein